jgi:hypothetical protein
METNPSTMTAEPLQLTEVTQAVQLTDKYVDSGTQRLAQVAEIIGGEQAKVLGINADNIKKVMMFIGAYTSLKFVYEKAGEHKWKLLGGILGVIAVRKALENKNTQSSTVQKQA